jgi:hypothetical protein
VTFRQRLHLATRLAAAYAGPPPPGPEPGEDQALADRVGELRQALRQWTIAHDRGLMLVQPGLRRAARASLRDVGRVLDRLRARLDEGDGREDPPGLGHWLAELGQLDDECDEVTVDWKAGILAVTTEQVTLKDVELGRFKVVFSWARAATMPGVRCFDVVALDPNPAQGQQAVSHPHVRDESLCAGDAARPLEDAVKEGRLAEAFLMVRSVLMTYNPRSPYFPLEEWDGTPCGDCGDSVGPDDRSSCDACHATLCDSCVCSCAVCSDYRCPDCLSRCDGCRDGCCAGCLEVIDSKSLCPSCIGTCAECDARVPAEDLDPDAKLCPDCHLSEPDDDDTKPVSPAAPAEPNPLSTSIPTIETVPLSLPALLPLASW